MVFRDNAEDKMYAFEIAGEVPYKSGLYFKRNRYLVDNSDICIAYYHRNGSGTAYTVNYATTCKKKVINLANE